MTYRVRRATVGACAASWLAALAFAGCHRAPASQADAAAKPPCLGCAVDGKTTPRGVDGHPDLNGFWNGAAPNPNAPARGNARGGGRVMNRYPDGSIIFDFSTEYNEENGVGRICQDDSCQDK